MNPITSTWAAICGVAGPVLDRATAGVVVVVHWISDRIGLTWLVNRLGFNATRT